jgi:Family of unknown function (DUF6788)
VPGSFAVAVALIHSVFGSLSVAGPGQALDIEIHHAIDDEGHHFSEMARTYEWGHMKEGKLVHRMVTAEQAKILRRAIANYRNARKLLKDWEEITERLIDAQAPRQL